MGCRVTEALQGAVRAGPEACCLDPVILSHLSPLTALSCGGEDGDGRDVCVDGSLNSTSVISLSAFLNTNGTDMAEDA